MSNEADYVFWQSPAIDALATAIAKAQAAMEPAKRDHKNPFFNSKYADLSAVWGSLKPFSEHGIAIVQSPMEGPGGHMTLDTILAHSSGQWMRSRLTLKVSKDDPQGAGSALTYARRYALGCMTGVVTEDDDDGNAASTPAHKPSLKPSEILKRSEQAPQDGLDASRKTASIPMAQVVDQEGQHAAEPQHSFVWKITGKHKDESISTIDSSYLEWFAQNGKREDHVEQAVLELDRRRGQGTLA